MAFGQINYSETVGNGPYTIKEIGCFVDAFSNLMERFGTEVAPDVLNTFFTDNNVYLADPADGAGVKDILAWGSISAYDPTIHVTGTGTGWPLGSDNAIVKFIFKSPTTGQQTTHFCLVASGAGQTIVDSWDGKTRAPGYYGEPVAFATYDKEVPQPIAPVQPIYTPGPAAQPADVSFTTESIPAKKVSLKLDPTKLWDLNQTSWPAMTANPISSSPAGSIVDVVAIAHHKLGGQYYMPDATKAEGYNIVDCSDDIAPPAPAADVSSGDFTAFPEPMELVTNKEATIYNTATGAVITTLGEGQAFTALGKVENNGQVYFVPSATNTSGIKTVDLSPAPTAVLAAETGGEKVDVKVTSPSWQASFTGFLSPVEYVANVSTPVIDLNTASGMPKQQLLANQKVLVGGTFSCDGIKYYRTVRSITEGKWYGIPVTDLTKPNGEEQLLDKAVDEIKANHDKLVAVGGATTGFLERVLHRNKKGVQK